MYALDTRGGQDVDRALGSFTDECGFAPEEKTEVMQYMTFLARGVWAKHGDIDNVMRTVVTGWRPERMAAVDRAVLRLAIFEGFVEKSVPIAVAISEAVELARAFGTEDSGKFVNGVLSKVVRFATNDSEAASDTEVPTDG